MAALPLQDFLDGGEDPRQQCAFGTEVFDQGKRLLGARSS
jgi:hypothetical protein